MYADERMGSSAVRSLKTNMRVFSISANSFGLSSAQRTSHTSFRSKRTCSPLPSGPATIISPEPKFSDPGEPMSRSESMPFVSMIAQRVDSQLIATVCGRDRS